MLQFTAISVEILAQQHPRWAADVRNPLARERLYHPAVIYGYTISSSAIVNPFVSLRVSQVMFFSLGRQLFTPRAASIMAATFSPHVRDFCLHVGLKRSGTTDGATLHAV